MSQKEIQRFHVLKQVLEARLSLKSASELMGVSYRHAKRLITWGGHGLVHGNMIRPALNRISDETRKKILAFIDEETDGSS